MAKNSPLIELVLPWPNSNLSPNVRIHYQLKAKYVKASKQTGFLIALEKAKGYKLPDELFRLEYDFYPPDRRHRDDDNFIAMMKGCRDGIFLALDQDDVKVKRTICSVCDPTKKGLVILRIYKLNDPIRIE